MWTPAIARSSSGQCFLDKRPVIVVSVLGEATGASDQSVGREVDENDLPELRVRNCFE